MSLEQKAQNKECSRGEIDQEIKALQEQITFPEESLPKIGSFIQGGYYAGLVNIKGVVEAIIVAPKVQGEYEGNWAESNGRIIGSNCQVNGQQNTLDMIVSDVKLAKWVGALEIGGFKDWHIPSRDQLEIIYRAFKPANYANAPYSGINANSVPAHDSYTSDEPLQCDVEAFKRGGSEAFDHTSYYWTSTQIDGNSVCILLFHDGLQTSARRDNDFRARAIRTININELLS